MQAARIEEAVVPPKIEQDILGIYYLITVFAQAFQNFGLAVGEFLLYSGMGQYLCDRVEMVIAYFETGLFLLWNVNALPTSALMRTISSCMPKGFFR